MITNAFTCTGSYAILILCGIKRTENRSAWPEPSEGRAAISCSKSFCKEEYGQFVAWASVHLPPEDFEKIPAWRDVKDWPGKIVGVCDYKARTGQARLYQSELFATDECDPSHQTIQWDEGYPYWWDLSNVVRLRRPIPCRGNVGMWQLPPDLAIMVARAWQNTQPVKDGIRIASRNGAHCGNCRKRMNVGTWRCPIYGVDVDNVHICEKYTPGLM